MQKRKNIYVTRIVAVDPKDGIVKEWGGPNVEASSFEEAEQICDEHFGFLEVIGQLDYRASIDAIYLWPEWEPFSDN